MKCQVHLARYPFFPAECRSKHGVSFNLASSLPLPHSCCPGLRTGTRAAGFEPLVTATMDWERNQARGSNRKRRWRRGGTSEQLGNKGRAQRRREAWKRIGSTRTEFLTFPSPGILASPFPFKLLHLPPPYPFHGTSFPCGCSGSHAVEKQERQNHTRAGRLNHPRRRVSKGTMTRRASKPH